MWAPDVLQEATESGEEGFERHCPTDHVFTPVLKHACLMGPGICIAVWCVFLLLCPFLEVLLKLRLHLSSDFW